MLANSRFRAEGVESNSSVNTPRLSHSPSESLSNSPATPLRSAHSRQFSPQPYAERAWLRNNASRETTPARETDGSPRQQRSYERQPLPELFPTFSDFLPALNRVEEDTSSWKGLGPWNKESVGLGVSFGERDVTEQKGKVERAGMRGDAFESMDPFASFDLKTPTTDSFTFYPSPQLTSSFSGVAASPQQVLRSPMESQTQKNDSPNRRLDKVARRTDLVPSHVFSTPPASRRVSLLSSASPAFVPSYQSPGEHSPIEQFTNADAFYEDVGTRSRSASLPNAPASPLSSSDADLIAALHGGRRPNLGQLAPPSEFPLSLGLDGTATSGGNVQPEIRDTGNIGPMVVQAGDWECLVCQFVNWRRRKICMRCFPFANDIGKLLTINSNRAATLATPEMQLAREAFLASQITSARTAGSSSPETVVTQRSQDGARSSPQQRKIAPDKVSPPQLVATSSFPAPYAHIPSSPHYSYPLSPQMSPIRSPRQTFAPQNEVGGFFITPSMSAGAPMPSYFSPNPHVYTRSTPARSPTRYRSISAPLVSNRPQDFAIYRDPFIVGAQYQQQDQSNRVFFYPRVDE